jgi:DNA-binding NarL/FixJ family response regulator
LTLSFSADQNGLSYERPSIVVVDCRPLPRSCLARVLRSEFQDFSIFEAETILQIDAISGRHTELVVLNIGSCSLTDENVLQKLAAIRRSMGEAPVMLLAQVDEATVTDTMISEVTRFGVRGYVTDAASIDIALAALRLVIAGGAYFPRSVLMDYPNWENGLSDNIVALQPNMNGAAAEAPVEINKSNVAFTEREGQVLASLLRGLSNKVIANELNLSQNTVKSHISRIMHKLHAKNRTEAVVLSQRSGPPVDGRLQGNLGDAAE